MKYLILYLLLFLFFSCKKSHAILGIGLARQELKDALLDTSGKQNLFVKGDLKNQQAVVSIVEPILFKAYGKDNIVNEKPYELYSIDSYWVLMGTLPEQTFGGTFLIAFSAKDGRVIKLTHGK
jgi:hypothetical protein